MKNIPLLLTLASLLSHPVAFGQGSMESVVVTASRVEQNLATISSSISVVGEEQLELLDALHPYQLFTSVHGAWIRRGKGQENLTAIRSPVYTGPGSCG